MAQESSIRRNFRTDYDHASGDNFHDHLQNSKHSDFDLNVEMVEREGVAENGPVENRYLGGLVGNKELMIMGSFAVCMYLVNGEYAQSVCTALTSVPPAVFSYRVLINQQTTKQGYHTILFYWTLYGLIALIDQFVGTAQGYNLCKGGLLSVVFFHAVRSNSVAIPPSWKFLDQASTDIITTLFSRYDGLMEDNTSGYGVKTPTMSQFSDESLQYMIPESDDFENIRLSTAHSFMPSLEMQTTQNVSNNQKSQSSSLQTMIIPESSHVSYQKSPKKNFQSMSAMTMTCNGNGDIVTVPADRITFSNDSREEVIRVTNVSQLHIMFALKTNADTYLIAAPTSGILFSGQTMTIRIGVTDKYYDDLSDPGVSIDKLAIDYTVIPGQLSSHYSNFNPKFFQSQNRRRMAIRVFYQ